MVDVFDGEKRSQVMSAIRSKNTKLELLLRKALHARGYRYRLHGRHLPGVPDLVLCRFNAVLFIHGCFWHGHDCPLFREPSTNRLFWKNKILANRERDAKVCGLLSESGWRVLTVWECSLRGTDRMNFDDLISAVENWLISGANRREIGSGSRLLQGSLPS